jgi:hypothetical protein
MRPTSTLYVLLLGIITITLQHTIAAFQLKSSSAIPNIDPTNLHNFLATPSNWPDIVLSSHSVKGSENRVDIPLKVGQSVEEIFGLPPLLPLSVEWKCVKSNIKDGKLEFYSKDGVPGFANECKMIFNIQQKTSGSECVVDLIMDFEPTNPLIPFAVPFLSIDNNLALNVLLPKAIQNMFT